VFNSDIWKFLTPMERFYVKGLEVFAEGWKPPWLK
jgi:hypothetical protein